MPTITFPTADKAQFVADIFAGTDHRVSVDGTTVTLDNTALAHLADLNDETDGHYDGCFVWISGTEYEVEA